MEANDYGEHRHTDVGTTPAGALVYAPGLDLTSLDTAALIHQITNPVERGIARLESGWRPDIDPEQQERGARAGDDLMECRLIDRAGIDPREEGLTSRRVGRGQREYTLRLYRDGLMRTVQEVLPNHLSEEHVWLHMMRKLSESYRS
ncbi:hypothetical protein [Nocardiopsis rhodophaea]|uniref:hypothetical protein n=1 Tax=Nocardiopsis rhodophaea TaxID=280238 RepID=UPI0031DAC63F